jgi:hypothetical protein
MGAKQSKTVVSSTIEYFFKKEVENLIVDKKSLENILKKISDFGVVNVSQLTELNHEDWKNFGCTEI